MTGVGGQGPGDLPDASGRAVPGAPIYRIWPPVALGTPLLLGVLLTGAVGDPFAVAGPAAWWSGWVCLGCFAVWNWVTLIVMARHRTAVLPGGATRTLLRRGPFRVSRNPLYLGLIALDVGVALLALSAWALLLVPVGVAALRWGAIGPEERHLERSFGAEYSAYRRTVRRWL